MNKLLEFQDAELIRQDTSLSYTSARNKLVFGILSHICVLYIRLPQR